MLGATALSFTCPADRSICYSVNSPSTHAVFQDLQAQINRFAGVAGFSPITQDGLIGDGTVSAAKKAMSYAESRLPDGGVKASVIALRPMTMSRQALAPAAVAIGDILREAAIALGLAAPSPGGGGGGGGGYVPSPTLPTPTVPTFPGIPGGGGFWAARTPTQKALIGVGGAVALGALALAFWPKKKRSQAA